MTLKVYDNGFNHIVAKSIEDAWLVWCETTGEDRADYDEMEWGEESSDKRLTIRFEEYANLYSERPDGAIVEEKGDKDDLELVSATFRAWAKLNGRGWLCSTEY